MTNIAKQTIHDLATPPDVQLFFTYQSICQGNCCLNGYALALGSVCLDPVTSVSITAGGHKYDNWEKREIHQIAKTAAHELGTIFEMLQI